MRKVFSLMLLAGTAACGFAQDASSDKQDLGSIRGTFQTDVQKYYPDSLIDAKAVDEKVLSNTYLQLTYQRGNFTAGMRYEAYFNPLLGYDPRYAGQGIANRFAQYHNEKLDITVGNIYEQFGNGLVLRAYQEWSLGLDNSIDGFRAKFTPIKGVQLKGIMGKQRKFWDKSQGIVRAADAEVVLNEVIPALQNATAHITVGGSFTSRYLADNSPKYNLPANVSASAARLNMNIGNFDLAAEYAHKINDPFDKNGYSYNPGNALYLNASYSSNFVGVNVTARRIDNFDFRSERDPSFQELTISFLPACTRQHTWRLPTLYPYATQLNGEMGGQAELIFNLNTVPIIGGKGAQFTINYSQIYGLDTTHTSPYRYEVKTFGSGNHLYFRDVNFEYYKKWNKKLKTTLAYINLIYDKSVIELGGPDRGGDIVHTNVFVGEFTYKFSDHVTLRTEAQAMLTKQDKGSWYMLLAELSLAPHWSITAFDEYNAGNPNSPTLRYQKANHYPNFLVAYLYGSTRIALGYAKQRAGLLCVGGICRVVPASNGFNVSIMTSF